MIVDYAGGNTDKPTGGVSPVPAPSPEEQKKPITKTPPDAQATQTQTYAYDPDTDLELAQERERLNLFAHLHLDQSIRFLEKEGIAEAASFADIGCGTGYLCTSLAELYPNLKVYGLDINNGHVSTNSDEKNSAHNNLAFARYDLMEVSDKLKDKFDIVNSTLVMAHMKDPIKAVENMKALVKPGGKLSAEEIDIKSLGANKEFPALYKFKELWEKMIIAVDGDTHRGSQLEDIFNQAGLENIQSRYYITKEPQAAVKGMIIKVLESPSIQNLLIKDRLVENKDEIKQLISDLERGFDDPEMEVVFYNMHQVIGTKPKS